MEMLLVKRTASVPFGRAGASPTAFLSQQDSCWKEPLRQQPVFAIRPWILGCWQRILSQQRSFPIGKDFFGQQPKPLTDGKLWVVGEAPV
jgi:hypothetical protein